MPGSVTPVGRWDVFTPYTGLHLVSVLACFAVIAALIAIGRRLSPAAERRYRWGLAIFAFSVWTIYNIAWNWNGVDYRFGLPLHICDVSEILAPLALITQNRWIRATLYFWATALTTQAFIQPTLTFGPASILFWCFWIAHTIILGYAIYDLVVLRFRPDWSDYRRAAIVSFAYMALVLPINIALNANYGYVGNPPPPAAIPPFIAALGPWPGRVVILMALIAIAYVIVLLPWRIAARLTAREANARASREARSQA